MLTLDPDRHLRTGVAEAVYGPGKTPEQCAAAVSGLLGAGSRPVLLTRATGEQIERARAANPDPALVQTGVDPRSGADLWLAAWRPLPERSGTVFVLTAGTSDLGVAREVEGTLAAYGHQPELIADVGVAGIDRLLSQRHRIAGADAVVVAAGMEGALASVAAGLTSAPVVAVPTSTGYGAALEGVTALLAMHATCSPGVSVVGIDNGFGAACCVVRMMALVPVDTPRPPGVGDADR